MTPELDSCDSASVSAASSTLVVTPFSGHNPTNNSAAFKSPQPLKLQQLAVLHPNPMYQSSQNKGPIQPHVSNLPRRKPRRTTPASPSPSPLAKSLSSASIRTNAAASPSLHSPSPPSSSSSSSSPSPPPRLGASAAYFDPDDSPSVAGANMKFTPISIAPTPTTTPSTTPHHKGHVQPHITHMPRRRRRPLLPRATTTPEQRTARARAHCERKSCLHEVVRGEGVWVALWDWDWDSDRDVSRRRSSETNGNGEVDEEMDDEEDHEKAQADREGRALFEKDLLRSADRMIRVCYSSSDFLDPPDDSDGSDSTSTSGAGAEEADGSYVAEANVLRLRLPARDSRDPRIRDDGLPHMSERQMARAREFMGIQDGGAIRSSKDETEIETETATEVASRNGSTESCHLERRRLLIAVPSKSFAVDALALGVISAFVSRLCDTDTSSICSPLSTSSEPSQGSPSSNPNSDSDLRAVSSRPIPIRRTIDMIARLNDFEDLVPPWKGVLSCDGVELLDQMLGLGTGVGVGVGPSPETGLGLEAPVSSNTGSTDADLGVGTESG